MIKIVKQKKITSIDGKTEILDLEDNEVVHKIGIQGPSSVELTINGNTFYIGKSGILEFEDNLIDFQKIYIINSNGALVNEDFPIYVDYVITKGV